VNTRQRIVLGIAIAVVAIGTRWLVATTYKTYNIPSDAMAPTIPAGTHVVARLTQDVGRGDIIVFRYPLDPKVPFLKRIAAQSGDTIEIRDKRVFVNQRELTEPYAMHDDEMTYPRRADLPETYRSRDQYGPYRVPPDSFFVLGDNRDRSADSRYWGAVPHDNVLGRVIATYSITGFHRVR
jgi:signal peptidase I